MRSYQRWSCRGFGGLTVMAVAALTAGTVMAQSTVPDGEWHAFGRDGANTKYSPLDQITAENFTDLQIAWRWTSLSQAVVDSDERIKPRGFVATPLMVDGLVYTVTALGQVAALDAGTGEQVWDYDPRIYDYLERPPNMGWHHRGLSYWDDPESNDARIFIASHDLRLVALNAQTGAQYADFGLDGYVDLGSGDGFERAIDRSRMTYSSPVTIIGDTVIVGSIIQDTFLTQREANPGYVRAYDARTGEMKWIFRTIPQGDDFGVDSWGNESWRYSGTATSGPTWPSTRSWVTSICRPARRRTIGMAGCARATICSPRASSRSTWKPGSGSGTSRRFTTGSGTGIFRPGPTCSTSPSTAARARSRRSCRSASKRSPTWLDRVTGEPVWPIEERPVPQGNVPGEWYSPTQPFSDQAAAVRPSGHHHRRPDRLHAGAAGRGARDRRRPRAVRADLLAAGPARRREALHSGTGRRRRRELAGRGGRPGDRTALRVVVEYPRRRRGDQIRVTCDGRVLYRPVGSSAWRDRGDCRSSNRPTSG